RPPFLGTDSARVMKAHMEEEVVPPARRDPSIPAALSDLVVKMMAKDPAKRHPHPTALLAHIERVREALLAPPAAAPAKAAVKAPETPAAPAPSAQPQAAEAAPAATEAGPAPSAPKARARRAGVKGKVPAILWAAIAVGALLAGAAVLSQVFSGRGGGGEPPEGPSTGEKGGPGPSKAPPKGETPDPAPGPTAPPPKPEAADELLRAAENALSSRPDDLAAAIARFREAEKAGAGTEAGARASRRIAELSARRKEADRRKVEEARAAARVPEEAGRLAQAVALFEALLAEPGFDADAAAAAREASDGLRARLASRWAADRVSIDALVAAGKFDEAVRAVRAAVDPATGYATAALLLDETGDDPEAMIAAFGAQKTAWNERVAKEAGPRLAKFEEELKALLSTGRGPGAAGEALGLLDRLRAALDVCRRAPADPLLAVQAHRVQPWIDELASVEALEKKALPALQALAQRGGRVRIRGQDAPVAVVRTETHKEDVIVVPAAPAPRMLLPRFLAALDENDLVALFEAAAGKNAPDPRDRLALAWLCLWSTPGGVAAAPKRAAERLEAASEGGIDVARSLGFLEARRAELEDGEAVREAEAALVLAQSADRKKQEAALKELVRILAEHGQKPGVSALRGRMEEAIAALKRKPGVASETVTIPFLTQPALAWDAARRTIEIEYDFAKPWQLSDWTTRAFGDLKDEWYQRLLTDFLGRNPQAVLKGREVQFTGGGYWVWKPRLEGDMEMEADLCPFQRTGLFVLFCLDDTGGYAFNGEQDFAGLAGYARQAGIPMPAFVEAGLSNTNLNWPQSVALLKGEPGFSIQPRAAYKVRAGRKAGQVFASVSDAKGKLLHEFQAADENRKGGRVGFALIKSSMLVARVRVRATLEEAWTRSAEAEKPDDRALPGTAR
ncbi:MAG: hypothetical protein MUC63_01895, partial [Planctomycetes bacterium]|nr:hypothetical protein [Planctomycetota bacterium]